MKLSKKIIGLILSLMFIFTALPASAAYTGETVYDHKTELHDALTLNNTAINGPAGKVESTVVTLKPGKGITPIVTDGGDIYGGIRITGAMNHVESLGYHVVGAVNADFFTVSNGIPRGIVIENGILLSSDDGENAVGFNADGTAFIGTPALTLSVKNNTTGEAVKVEHFNKLPSDYALTLLNSDFEPGYKIAEGYTAAVLEKTGGNMAVGGSVYFTVKEIVTGPYELPENGYVLTAASESEPSQRLALLNAGDKLTLTIKTGDKKFEKAAFACGGGDILISGGKITDEDTWSEEIIYRNPRTALGIKQNGEIVIFTNDGRQTDYSAGLTLRQLAGELDELGCYYAINLDGGGSTAIALRQPALAKFGNDPDVINSPSGSLRSCGTYIVLVSDSAPDGVPNKLFYGRDGWVMGKNSTVTPVNLMALDSGLVAVDPPEDVTLEYTGSLGYLEDGVFYAGNRTGTAEIKIKSASAEGTMRLHIVDKATNLVLKLNSETTGSMEFEFEDPDISLTEGGKNDFYLPLAKYYGREIHSAVENFDVEIKNIDGVTIENWVIYADRLTAGKGELVVSFGDYSESFPFTVTPVFDDTVGTWAEQYVTALGAEGAIDGEIVDGQRLFYPWENITRRDLFVMMARRRGLDITKYEDVELPFKDADEIGEEAIGYIKALYAKGILAGSLDAEGNLWCYPDAEIARQEAFSIIGRSYIGDDQRYTDEEIEEILAPFGDKGDISDWAKQHICWLIKTGAVQGGDGGLIRPYGTINRAEAAKVVYMA